MPKTQLKKTMEGAFILTIAAFIAKILSAVYRVPFQNSVGDEGFYVYQQVYPIYGLAMTLALTGLPQFISRIVAENAEVKKQRERLEEMYPLVFLTSILLWGVTFFFGGLIAEMMGDSGLKPLIQIVSFAFLLVPPISFYRGAFQGNLQMIPTAVSQVSEQLFRVGVILVAAACFQRFSLSVYQTGALAMTGALVGAVAAWGILRYYDHKIYGAMLDLKHLPVFRSVDKKVRRRFLIEGGLISVYSGFLILFQLLDSFMIANSLTFSGITEQAARIDKGIYDRGQPLVQLGLVVATALSSTFLPTLTKYLTNKNPQLFSRSAKMYLRLTVSIAFAASFGMAILLPYINFALFKDSAGNNTLSVFVFSIALMAVIQAYQSIQQSRNIFRSGLIAAGIGLLIKAATTWQLSVMWGTIGASISTLLGLLGTLLYFMKTESLGLNAFWKEAAFLKKLIQCLLLMAVSLLLYKWLVALFLGSVTHRLPALLISIGGGGLGASVFISSALRLRLLTIREWLLIPFGKKLLHFGGGNS